MAKQIITIGGSLTLSIGVLDENGDTIETKPIQIPVQSATAAGLNQAFAAYLKEVAAVRANFNTLDTQPAMADVSDNQETVGK